MYGRIGSLKRVLEKPRKQSHTLLPFLSFSTEDGSGYGGGGESQQQNSSSRVKIFDRDLKRVHVCRAQIHPYIISLLFSYISYDYFFFFCVFGIY